MIRYSKISTCRYIFIFGIIISCIISFKNFLSTPIIDDVELINNKHIISNISDPFLMINIIDQFLNTKDYNERDNLWSLLIQSWLKLFKNYLKRTENLCTISDDFISIYLNEYTKKLLLDNKNLQRNLTGLGLFFDYNIKEIHSKNHPILHNVFLSSCTYFELILLIMKVQFILFKLNINYFIGQNTLIGALRHHNIIPWHTIVEFNLPLIDRKLFLNNINKKFQLIYEKINHTYINTKQIGYIYKIYNKNKIWPQIEIYFYQENSTHIYDIYNKIGYLDKKDVFPFHLRPFGPLLLFSIKNSQSMISNEKLNICENFLWNYKLDKETDIDHQYRISCEHLYTIYLFVQSKYSWRQGYCEETLYTQRAPFKILSYFRYICPQNITQQLR